MLRCSETAARAGAPPITPTPSRRASDLDTRIEGGPAEPGQAESGILLLAHAGLGQRCALTFKTRRASLGTIGKNDSTMIGESVHFSSGW